MSDFAAALADHPLWNRVTDLCQEWTLEDRPSRFVADGRDS